MSVSGIPQVRIYVFETCVEVAEFGSGVFVEKIRKNTDSVLGLAAGVTPLALYKKLIADFNQIKFQSNALTTFNLDEYVGLNNEKNSYRQFIDRELFQSINIPIVNTHVPNGHVEILSWEAFDMRERYVTQVV